MWRDRTNLYISYRQSYSHHPTKKPRYLGGSNGFADQGSEETRGLMSSSAYENDGDAVIEMDLLPPRWMDVQEEVDDVLKDITLKAAKLDKLHAKHVLPGFDDESIKQQEEREIEKLTQEITRGFQECQKAIKRIETMVREAKQTGNLQKGEEVMAKNMQTALASRVQEVSATFRKKQSLYLNKLRALGGFESPIGRSSTPVQNPYSDPALMESDADKSFSQSTLQQTAQKRFRSNDTAIAQREQEINDIAKGIIELADIFRDLQAMVIDQGTMLDRIDYNVERMATDVKGAEKELTVATNYQRRNTKRKILLLLLLLVIGMFVLLLVKPKRRSQSAPAPPTTPVAPESPP
ncbi:t-SNARE affecting a late Golgi compartment protein 2 [Exophiala dermatitidis]|uniref:t-SNARE affecting a late Golgi compartment protein 2 n=1 Tax=Exophiala dermatitidis TaxID=5970 RepID=A0AAN6EUD0_EXODE|nr:t-SNARE affecting a late Golgi compartment protein 2 [Exophiala dermatitidis]KAJ4534559.1 t-SNARE affecting a late Golgi compartment protein 2 [Exophiala dermatitidis]KAJ4560969.1 t-SNARE affecting a late Golgi compartment protein 2 [Exophiala dermatitidis]KAJ4561131.1 t-SNARE affecting a late Golgi compartment protein 2 [Exophiala dermatitidis]KAJ4569137.1 t-SNARE affecting a late Golgi compartment protein 2 [Exophiala dermatitidis]